jgi:hypothetical protein
MQFLVSGAGALIGVLTAAALSAGAKLSKLILFSPGSAPWLCFRE